MRVLIDCDPGLDDALAIALALASPELQLDGIFTVAGNADIDAVSRNALAIVKSLQGRVPVYRGNGKALDGDMRLGTSVWGGAGCLGLAPSDLHILAPASQGYAAQLAGDKATVAALGPLTNIAKLFSEAPASARNIERIVVMGGSFGRGNATPHAEFNVWADPHAAAAVFAAGIPIVVAPLNVTREIVVPESVIRELATGQAKHAAVLANLLALTGKPGHPAAIHDACTIAWLLWPDLFTTERGMVSVETADTEYRGATRFEPQRKGLHTVLTKADGPALVERIFAALGRSV